MDRLQPADKHLLQVASVAGEYVPITLLNKAAGRREEDFQASLFRLQAKEFLYEYRVLPTQEFCFGHALIREVAYRSVPHRQRRAMHAHMVELLEEAEQDRSTERLSYHALRAELWEKTVNYSLAAADKSIDQSAFREAATFLRRAIRALDHLPQTQQVVTTAIDVRMRLRVAETGAPGGLAKLEDDLQTAAQLAVKIDDKPRQARVAIHHGYISNMLGNTPAAEAQAKSAYRLAQQIGDHYLLVESAILLAQTFSYAGKPLEIATLLMPHMDYLTHDIRHDTMGQTMIRSVVACAHIAMSEAFQGKFDSAKKWVAEGQAIAEEATRPFDLVYMQFTQGVCLDFKGEFRASIAAHEKAVEIAEANDIWFMMTFAQPWRGHALFKAGRLSEALEVLCTTQLAARRAELPLVEAACRGFSAQVCRALGHADKAEADAEAALAFGQTHDVPLLEFLGLKVLGDRDKARAVAEKWNYVVWAEEL